MPKSPSSSCHGLALKRYNFLFFVSFSCSNLSSFFLKNCTETPTCLFLSYDSILKVIKHTTCDVSIRFTHFYVHLHSHTSLYFEKKVLIFRVSAPNRNLPSCSLELLYLEKQSHYYHDRRSGKCTRLWENLLLRKCTRKSKSARKKVVSSKTCSHVKLSDPASSSSCDHGRLFSLSWKHCFITLCFYVKYSHRKRNWASKNCMKRVGLRTIYFVPVSPFKSKTLKASNMGSM